MLHLVKSKFKSSTTRFPRITRQVIVATRMIRVIIQTLSSIKCRNSVRTILQRLKQLILMSLLMQESNTSLNFQIDSSIVSLTRIIWTRYLVLSRKRETVLATWLLTRAKTSLLANKKLRPSQVLTVSKITRQRKSTNSTLKI
jgi:hypothetical protein